MNGIKCRVNKDVIIQFVLLYPERVKFQMGKFKE